MRIRRSTASEPRLEMTPLIDVVFLLLTFFVFALVLMVRVDVMGVRLPALGAADAAEPGAVVSVTVSREGELRLDGTPIERDALAQAVLGRLEDQPEARLFLVLDERGVIADLVDVMNRLRAAGITDLQVVGRPEQANPDQATPGRAEPGAPD